MIDFGFTEYAGFWICILSTHKKGGTACQTHFGLRPHSFATFKGRTRFANPPSSAFGLI